MSKSIENLKEKIEKMIELKVLENEISKIEKIKVKEIIKKD